MKESAKYHPVRVDPETYAILREVVVEIAQNGWRSVGSKRQDGVTIGSVVAEAISQLRRKKR